MNITIILINTIKNGVLLTLMDHLHTFILNVQHTNVLDLENKKE